MITINCSRIDNRNSGIYSFSKSIVKCLAEKIGDCSVFAKESIDFEIPIKKHCIPKWLTMAQNVAFFRLILWHFYTNKSLNKIGGNILSTTHHIIPKVKHQIITIHDIRPLFHPDRFIQHLYFKYLIPIYIKNIDGVITVSIHVKEMIIKHYHVPSEKIYIVPNCVDISTFYPRESAIIEKERYFITVGATIQHKNAHEIINNSGLWINKYKLIIIAGEGKYRNYMNAMVNKLDLSGKVDFLNYVTQDELVFLYQNAAALIYPSQSEGFGIPILEAMACGIPVILSDIPVFHEIFGDIPIYVEIGSQKSWENAIKLLEDSKLIAKKCYQGVQKAKEYSEVRLCNSLMTAISSLWPEIN